MKRGREIIIFLILILLIVPLISAGFFSDVWGKITGMAESQLTNVSITVSGVNPAQITYVSLAGATIDPIENSSKSITFYLTMYDADGVADLNDSSVESKFTKTGEITRQNLSCSLVGDIDANSANYSCMIDMWYWDGDGAWTINVSGADLGNKTRVYNDTTTFNYNLLKAMVISPTSLTWPAVSPGDTNKTSENDPTTVNNTGNYNSTIQLTAINLAGEIITTQYIYAANFSVDIDTGDSCSGADCVECNGITPVNGTATTITGTIANRGNLSTGGGAGQEEIYYCITEVPSVISSQTYSTLTGGSWTVLYP